MTPAPFNVITGPVTVDGQVTMGYVAGLRTAVGDVIVFCACEAERDAIVSLMQAMLPATPFNGAQPPEARCALVRESQVKR